MRSTVLLVVALLALLAGAATFAYFGLIAGPGTSLGVHGWTAMALGTFFTLVVGIGLMALVFYSNRHGYDEPPHTEQQRANEQSLQQDVRRE